MPLVTAQFSAMLVIGAVLLQTVCGFVVRPSNRDSSNSALPECETELEKEESRLSDHDNHAHPLAVVPTTFSQLTADQIYSGRVVALRYLHASDSTLLLAACRAPPTS